MIDEYVRAIEEAVASLGNLTRASVIYNKSAKPTL